VTEPDTISVVIVDDHPLYRLALADAVRKHPRAELVAEAADAPRAIDVILELRPDVAILDVHLDQQDGVTVAEYLAARDVPTRYLFISGDDDGPLVHRTLASGGSGFLSKNATVEEIQHAIDEVAAGRVVLGAGATANLAGELQRSHGADQPSLSERELAVLERVAGGRSVAQMAEDLHLSSATVKFHLQGLYAKLGVNERAAAVAEAMRRGLIR